MLKDKLKNLFPDVRKGIGRFPLTVLSGVLYFILTIIYMEADFNVSYQLQAEVMEYMILILISIPLLTACELIREKYFSQKNRGMFRLGYLFLITVFLTVCKRFYLNGISGEEYMLLNLFTIGIIAYLLFLLIPLIYRKKNIDEYFQVVISDKIITIVFSIILFLGMAAIIGAVDVLLINVDNNLYYYSLAFSVFIFGLTHFLSRMREPEDEMEDYEMSRTNRFLLSYILVPLIIGYTVILYIYMAKIIILFKMPQGILSHMVVWYMVFTLFILIIITPLAMENKFIEKFRKLFPLFSIPLLLLALMSIYERVSQYGVTENRYIIIVLVLWLLFNMIFFVFRKDVRIVIISLISVIFISVFTPLNMTKISVRSQTMRLEKILKSNGLMKDGKLKKNVNINKEAKNEIMNIAGYLSEPMIGGQSRNIVINGKKYSTNEFMAEIGADYSWNSFNGGIYSSEQTISVENTTTPEERIVEIGNYRYFTENIEVLNVNDSRSSDRYEIKHNSEDEIAIVNRMANKEIMRINIEMEAKKVFEGIKERIKNKEGNWIKLSDKEMTVTGENSNGKYKISFKTIEFNEKGEVFHYRYDIYFSEK